MNGQIVVWDYRQGDRNATTENWQQVYNLLGEKLCWMTEANTDTILHQLIREYEVNGHMAVDQNRGTIGWYLADILTKSLHRVRFQELAKIGLFNLRLK
jgi:hypothetical protein